MFRIPNFIIKACRPRPRPRYRGTYKRRLPIHGNSREMGTGAMSDDFCGPGKLVQLKGPVLMPSIVGSDHEISLDRPPT